MRRPAMRPGWPTLGRDERQDWMPDLAAAEPLLTNAAQWWETYWGPVRPQLVTTGRPEQKGKRKRGEPGEKDAGMLGTGIGWGEGRRMRMHTGSEHE
jgi:hypothetical protein